MRQLIVPLDGSTLSGGVLAPAARLAQARSQPLHLLHVPTTAAAVPSLASLAPHRPGLPRTLKPEQAEEYLEDLATSLRDRWGIAVTSSLTPRVEPPEVSEVIADYAAARNAGLVVMSTRGHSGFKRLFLGSVADGLLRHSSTPLLLFPPRAALLHATHPQLFQRVLVPLDGSMASESVLTHMELLPAAPQRALVLLRVITPVASAGDVPLGGAEALDELKHSMTRVRGELTQLATKLTPRFPGVRVHVQVAPLPAEAILSYARQWEADLIALTSSGRDGLDRLRLGSVAAQILAAAPCPMLVVRAMRASTTDDR